MASVDFADSTHAELDESPLPSACWITLACGRRVNVLPMNRDQLVELQWEQERAFAQLILRSPKGSSERSRAFAQGYDSVTTILGCRYRVEGSSAVMGYDPRYFRLVLKVLKSLRPRPRAAPRVFELGYGNGTLLRTLHEHGVEVSGIEVSSAMREQAIRSLPAKRHAQLRLGDFLSTNFSREQGTYDLVYWNDVFEHIPPDEISDYLSSIYSLLRPGGKLITITPNWHMRPSDITYGFRPLRSCAEGFHLKEYTLRETTSLLLAAGFTSVATPLLMPPGRSILLGSGFASCKRFFEPCIEWLPAQLAGKLCLALGLSVSIASKAGRFADCRRTLNELRNGIATIQ